MLIHLLFKFNNILLNRFRHLGVLINFVLFLWLKSFFCLLKQHLSFSRHLRLILLNWLFHSSFGLRFEDNRLFGLGNGSLIGTISFVSFDLLKHALYINLLEEFLIFIDLSLLDSILDSSHVDLLSGVKLDVFDIAHASLCLTSGLRGRRVAHLTHGF
jgi:hypothetical protein